MESADNTNKYESPLMKRLFEKKTTPSQINIQPPPAPDPQEEEEKKKDLDDIRGQLEDLDIDQKRESFFQKEDMEEISNSLKKVSVSLDDLHSILSRNKLPVVNFNSEEIKRVSLSDNPDSISVELRELEQSIRRIRMPEDRREWLSFEPHNLRSVIDGIDDLGNNLSSLRAKFVNAKSADFSSVTEDVVQVIKNLKKKRDGFEEILLKLRRYKDR